MSSDRLREVDRLEAAPNTMSLGLPRELLWKK